MAQQPRTTPVPADPEDLVARFATCRVSGAEWTHEAHLVVGLWHVHRYGVGESLVRLRSGIRRLNESHGTPNSATSGYHETITRAYVELLDQFLDSCPPAMPLAERVGRLLASPVAGKDVLLRFYSRARLMSPEARAMWHEPDIRTLEIGDLLETTAKAAGVVIPLLTDGSLTSGGVIEGNL